VNIQSFSFPLKPGNIVQHPRKRGDVRLLVLSRQHANSIRHRSFGDIRDYFREGDVLVLNDSKVIPTRLWGVLEDGGQREVTLVQRLKENVWTAYIRPPRGVRLKSFVCFNSGLIKATIVSKVAANLWCLKWPGLGRKVDSFLMKHAEINLPFYLRFPLKNPADYQTVYAKYPGSCQPPTAGLHFTNKILNDLRSRGVCVVYITLHVSGSILPTNVTDSREVYIPKEYYSVPSETAAIINRAKKRGNKITGVGTTVVRALETAAQSRGKVSAFSGWTELTIAPPFRFKVIDSFLTNFHLPSSSHMLMTCAFGGKKNVLDAYREALSLKYGFLDFGDAMLIVP
jgi:S-adenosylmethionine:tRNA ribosyltransferase-isomerase